MFVRSIGVCCERFAIFKYLYGLCVAAQSAEGGDERKKYLFHCFCFIREKMLC